jgi:hypothetical protein
MAAIVACAGLDVLDGIVQLVLALLWQIFERHRIPKSVFL